DRDHHHHGRRPTHEKHKPARRPRREALTRVRVAGVRSALLEEPQDDRLAAALAYLVDHRPPVVDQPLAPKLADNHPGIEREIVALLMNAEVKHDDLVREGHESLEAPVACGVPKVDRALVAGVLGSVSSSCCWLCRRWGGA